MAFLIGGILALLVGLMATFTGLDRDRAFFDFIHRFLVVNPGVPAWWPAFCLSFDVVAAAYLAWRLARAGVRAAAAP